MTHQNIFKSLPTSQLFSLMSNNEKYTIISLRAYYEFEDRYKKVLWNICSAVCKKNNFHKIVDLDKEVFRISMQEIYLNSDSFRESNLRVSRDFQDHLLIGWFGEIAETVRQNIISDHKKFDKLHLVVPDYHDHLEELKIYQHDEDEFKKEEAKKDSDEGILKIRMFFYEKGMQMLKTREREILLEYFSLVGESKYLSEDRIAYLCAKWKISKDNLLQIKYRAFQKLKRFCEDEQKKTENGSEPLNT